MDIHKPKAAHSWREFLIEIGTIICGILIALGLEQVVEQLHWRHEVEAARERLKPEYLRIARLAGVRSGQSPCVASRLDQLLQILDDASVSGHLPAIGPVLQPTRNPWTLRGWEAIVAGQVLSHTPSEEAATESNIAVRGEYMSRVRDLEMDHWAILGSLMGKGRRIDATEIAAYRTTLSLAAREAGILTYTANLLLADMVKTGVASAADLRASWLSGVEEGRAWIICKPLTATPQRFSAVMGGPPLAAEPKSPV